MLDGINYRQTDYFINGDEEYMSRKFAEYTWSRAERRSWLRSRSVKESTVDSWCQLAGANIVPRLKVEEFTRLEIMPDFPKYSYQVRFIAGLLITGYITRLPRFTGKKRTRIAKTPYFSYACSIVWEILTHQETEWWLGLSFTNISVRPTSDNEWEVVTEYNDFIYEVDGESPEDIRSDDGKTLADYEDREIPETA